MASKTGGYDCKFVDAPPDKLRCQICHLVARTPHQVTCCGRVYCKDYLDEHKRLSNTCPNCKETGQNFPDIRGERISVEVPLSYVDFLSPYCQRSLVPRPPRTAFVTTASVKS